MTCAFSISFSIPYTFQNLTINPFKDLVYNSPTLFIHHKVSNSYYSSEMMQKQMVFIFAIDQKHLPSICIVINKLKCMLILLQIMEPTHIKCKKKQKSDNGFCTMNLDQDDCHIMPLIKVLIKLYYFIVLSLRIFSQVMLQFVHWNNMII